MKEEMKEAITGIIFIIVVIFTTLWSIVPFINAIFTGNDIIQLLLGYSLGFCVGLIGEFVVYNLLKKIYFLSFYLLLWVGLDGFFRVSLSQIITVLRLSKEKTEFNSLAKMNLN